MGVPVLSLRLDGHCIETTARMLFRDMERCALEGGEVDEAAYALLSDFLRDTDFGNLRGERPVLDGRTKIFVRVFRKGEGFEIEEGEVLDN